MDNCQEVVPHWEYGSDISLIRHTCVVNAMCASNGQQTHCPGKLRKNGVQSHLFAWSTGPQRTHAYCMMKCGNVLSEIWVFPMTECSACHPCARAISWHERCAKYFRLVLTILEHSLELCHTHCTAPAHLIFHRKSHLGSLEILGGIWIRGSCCHSPAWKEIAALQHGHYVYGE